MDSDLSDPAHARYRLLGVQVVPHEAGVVIRRGSHRLFVTGEAAAEFAAHILARAAEGNAIGASDVPGKASGPRRDAFVALIEAMVAHRFLAPSGEAGEHAGGDDRPVRREAVFYWNYGLDLAAAEAKLAALATVVIGVNRLSLALIDNLKACGLKPPVVLDHPILRDPELFSEDGLKPEHAAAGTPVAFEGFDLAAARPACVVACSDIGGSAALRDWNRACVEAGLNFYPVVLIDGVAEIGPLVVPHDGPCLECLWLRRAARLDDPSVEIAVERAAADARAVTGYLLPMARAAADIAALDLIKHLGGALPGGGAGRLIRADLMAPSLTTHGILKVPRCPVCSRLSETGAVAADPFVAEAVGEGA